MWPIWEYREATAPLALPHLQLATLPGTPATSPSRLW
jgi:hypothetical protein